MFVNGAVLFNRAKKAFERAKETSENERQLGQMDALDGIIFSVVALEAFINEVSELACQECPPVENADPPSVQTLGKLLQEAEKSRGSLQLKYMLAFQVFTGQSYDASSLPFQDFSLLIDLRNAIVHYKTLESFTQDNDGEIEFKPAKLLSKLRSKNILAERENDVTTSWLNIIATAATARWACNTSSDVINSVIEITPDCFFKEKLKMLYQHISLV